MTEMEFIRATLTAGSQRLIERYRQRNLSVLHKGQEGELVTQVDMEMQDWIAGELARAFPADVLVAEENGRHAPPADLNGRCWVLDPIDGTHNFIRGLFPVFGISLAFAVNQEPQAGGVALPGVDRLYLAQRGAGAFAGDARLHVTDVRTVRESDVELDFCRLAQRPLAMKHLTGVLAKAREVLSVRSAVVTFCSLAEGGMDGFVHPWLNTWDYAAGTLLVTEAGGQVTHFDGRPIRLFDGDRTILASNGHIHDELRRLVKGE